MSKEWKEVVTGSSPGSPEDAERSGGQHDGASRGAAAAMLARRRILNADPRSISDDVTRTPIQVDRTPDQSTPKTGACAPAFMDPRSPSTGM